MSAANPVIEPSPEIKLDLGCGKNRKEGYLGVDAIKFDSVDVVHDIRIAPWPWEDNSVSAIHCSHVLEHLTNLDGKWERVKFFNEVYRILKPGCSLSLVIPHWASQRYYGDPTHKEPFSEFGFYYLGKAWRAVNAPHTDSQYTPDGYSCDFAEGHATWGYSVRQDIQVRNQEFQMFALTNYKEAAQDIIANVKKPLV